MAGGKQTPRQKMIGMMYLVLTAMLALNVSAEVLEAFVLVDNGLNQTLKSFRSKNEDYYNLIAAADRNNEAKAKKWMDKSLILKAKALELCKYIEEVKVKIVKTADGEKAEAVSSTGVDGHKVENKSDTSVPANILLGPNENGEAYTIKKRIEKFKGEILGLIEEKDRFPVLVQTITRILDTQDPPLSKDGERRTWASIRFEGVPLISTLPLLSNMQVDVLNCEALLLDHFFKQIDAQDVRVNAFDVVVVPESSTILKGETFKANVMLAAYDKTQLPSISVNGAPCKIEEGKGIYQAIGSSLGEKSLKCQVIVKGPDGIPQKYEKEYKYQVIQPMFTASPTKMNVLYRGIDNPVELSVSGIPNENVVVEITNASIRKAGGVFMVTPGGGRECEVRVFAKIGGTKKLMGTSSFRVKQLPPPTPRLDGANTKTISRSTLMSSLGIRAEMPQDFDFDLKYTVRSFVITGRSRDGYDQSESSNSAAFTSSQKSILANVSSGQRVFISEIKAVGPDGKVVELNDLVYKIR
jgi:gliding motility-associated protein GldM